MPTLLGDARIRIRPDMTGFRQTVTKEVDDSGKTATKHVSNIGKGLGLAAGAFAGVALVDIFKESTAAASDLAEAANKLQQLFGDAAPKVQEWASGAATSLGMSKLAAEDAAATFGVFAKSAGLAGNQSVDFSEKMVGLAADLASFHNTSPEEAIDAIGAAMRGEQEPIRRYGILIDDATTRQEAMKLGIISTTKNALTPQQRVLAVQSLLFKQAGAAQGDFARTSGGLANQQRILAANLENSKAALGQAFIPVALEVSKVLNNTLLPAISATVGFFADLPGPVKAVGGVLIGVVAVLGIAGLAFNKASGFIKELGENMGSLRGKPVEAAEGLKGSVKGLAGALMGPWGIAFTAATALVGFWITKQMEAKQHVADLADTLDKQTGSVTANTRAMVAKELQDNGVVEKAKSLHLNLGLVTDAATGNTAAMDELRSTLVPLSKQMEYVRDANGQMTYQQTAGARAAQDVLNALDDESGALKDAAAKNKELAQATAGANSALNTNNDLTEKSSALATLQKSTRDALTTALKGLNAALQASNNQFLIMRGAESAAYAAMDDLTASIKKNGTTLDVHTEKGRANRAALDSVASAALNYLSAQSDNVKASPKFASMLNDQRDRLITAAEKFGMGKTAAKKYADEILNVPKTAYTKVDTPGLAKAKQDIHNLEVQIQAMKSKTLEVVIDSHGNALLHDPNRGHGGMKDGGLVRGPGGPRDDKAGLFRLSDGEFVVNAQATSMHRTLLEHINKGFPGKANGGAIHVSTKANMPSADWTSRLLSKIDVGAVFGAFGGGSAPGGAGGAARWAPVILQALSMLGLGPGWLGTVESRMNRESGGNPQAINLWDSNALAGDPSKGLMQVIGGTFNAFAGPLRGLGIWNPLANIFAGLNYALHRYGSLAALNRPGGYAGGTLSAAPGWHWTGEDGPELVRFKGGESVKTNRQSVAATSAVPEVHVYIGERELTDLVDVRVDYRDRKLAQAVGRGRR